MTCAMGKAKQEKEQGVAGEVWCDILYKVARKGPTEGTLSQALKAV